MKLISHRGNIDGPNPDSENKPAYIESALSQGFNVETDVWWVDGQWRIGHNSPEWCVDYSWILQDGLWLHCKNSDALQYMPFDVVHYFFHQRDDYTLTSSNYVWTFPGKSLGPKSIVVKPDLDSYIPSCVAGICSDYIGKYK